MPIVIAIPITLQLRSNYNFVQIQQGNCVSIIESIDIEESLKNIRAICNYEEKK